MPAPLVLVKCDTCQREYRVAEPKRGFPTSCSLCKPAGRGKVTPVKR